MTALSDAQYAALGDQGFTGGIMDMELQWLKANGATSDGLSDAWLEMLDAQGFGPTNGYARSDGWLAMLSSLGYTGAVSDMTLQFWLNGGTLAKYTFNGVDQYATHAAWNSLGDPAVYASFAFVTDNPDGNIVDPTQPITEFGRVGTSYHTGSLSNLRYIDKSPIQGTSVKTGAVGTLPDIALADAVISFDYIVAGSDEDIIDGFVALTGSALVFDAGTANRTVDGSAYAGAAIPAGRHIRVAFTSATGTVSAVNAASGMQNLSIETTEYV